MPKARAYSAGRRGRGRPPDANRENTLLVLGGVVAALALLALLLTTRGNRGPVARAQPNVRIVPTLVGGRLVFEATNGGRTEARGIHAACIVRDRGSWPTLALHAPAGGQSLAGENLARGGRMEIALAGCMNARSVGAAPAAAYFLVRYVGANEEHVEETLIEFASPGAATNGYRSVDPAGASQYYRDALLAHIRRYAPAP